MIRYRQVRLSRGQDQTESDISQLHSHTGEFLEPTFDRLANKVLDSALARRSHVLLLDRTAAVVEALRLVHSALQGVSFPSKHVISVRTVRIPLEAPHERIGRARRPHAVESGRVPDRFVCDLRHANRVG
jgi:hypothetical protein